MTPTSDERDYESHSIKQPYTQRFMVHIPQPGEHDALGFPQSLTLKDVSRPHEGRREYVPRNIALLSESKSGRVYCSCCGRELKRDYLYSPSWRFCPRCGAEVLR